MSDTDLPPGAILLPPKQNEDLPPGAILLDGKKPDDKYRAAAKEVLARAPAPNALSDYTRRLTQGAGMNWTDEAMAFGTAPLEMIRRGEINPAEAYRYTKAREDLTLEGARERTGWKGSVVEALGGLASGGRAVMGAPGVITKAPIAIGGYLGNILKGATVGGVAGAGEGDTLGERAVGAGVGSVLGGAITAAAPAVVSAVKWAAQPLRRFVPSSPTAPITNVDDIALDQLNRSIERSGRTTQQVAQEVLDANAAGQPLILAEGIGTEGQRRLAGIAKAPGAARQWIDEDLVARDLGRTQRAQEAVDRGLGMPTGRTGEEVTQALTDYAQRASRPLYEAAEAVQPVWSPRMQEFFDHPEFQKALREGFKVERTRALAEGRPFNPADYAITQFDEAGDPIMSAVPNMRTIDLMKKGVDSILEKFRDPFTRQINTSDPYVGALQAAQRAMLREVDALNPVYGQARATYAGPARVRSAVETGRRLPSTGRPEDNVRRFNELSPIEQQGVRFGVADTIGKQISKATETGPLPAYLRSPKGRAELEAMSLYQGPRQPMPPNPMARPGDPQRFYGDPLRRALEREATMRQTLTQARGGSATAENAADMLDNLPPAPDYAGIFGNLMHGNVMGALRAVAPAAGRTLRGESEAQRTAMARLLMARDPAEVARIMRQIEELQARRGTASRARAGAAGAGGSMVLPQEQRQRLLQYLERQ